MATTQQVVSILRKAGKVACKNEPRCPIRWGYSVSKWNRRGVVSVLCNTDDKAEIRSIRQALEAAGLEVHKREFSAADAMLVR